MKLQKLLLLFFTAIYFFLSGCQKELHFPVEPIDPAPTPVTTDTSDYLDQVFSIDSISGVSDTTRITVYSYDPLKRVALQITYQNNLLASTTNYFYADADTLPFKAQQIDVENGMPHPQYNDTTNTFYTYDADGRNLYDSALYSIHNISNGQPYYQLQKFIKRYQYLPAKIFRLTSKQVLDGIPPINSTPNFSVDTAEVDANHNIIAYRHYSILSGGISQFTYLYEYTYDNKPSPLARLSNLRTLDPFPFSSKNNRLKIHYEFQGGTLDEDLSGRYIYKPNGYPSRLAFPSGSNYYHIESYLYKIF